MAWGMGLGRDRTRAGRILDVNIISQEEFAEESGLSRRTLNRICSENGYTGNPTTRRTFIDALYRMGIDVDEEDIFQK